MNRLELQKIPIYQTRSIAEAQEAAPYILNCLLRCYSGDYGIVPEEDTAANNHELEAGEGRILARYEAKEGLENDIYIDIHFSVSDKTEECNYGMIMYCDEY